MATQEEYRSRICDHCGKEGEPAPEADARERFANRVRQNTIPPKAKFEDYAWLVHCGSKPWAAPKKAEASAEVS